mmetsp:Transcript_4997/g.6460  ORF Transcript_4997/g.6460 Transcript_4997/m.6460 type:complete len:484 (+) Transcript_4997:585-2036(+)
MSGIAASGYDMHNVMLCDLMQVGCIDDTKLPTGKSEKWEQELPSLAERRGARDKNSAYKIQLTEAQQQSIDDAMILYDCSFRHLMDHANLTVLYNYQLAKNMESCPEQVNKQSTTQKLVFLAGPHKTASTSMQNVAFTVSHSVPEAKWKWIDPPATQEITPDLYNTRKSTTGLFVAMRGSLHNPVFNRTTTSEEMLNLYREEIQNVQKEGLNMIFGSENIDILASDYLDSDRIMDQFLSVLPKQEDNQEVSIVVSYRSPRVAQLQSLWREDLNTNWLGISFVEWILYYPHIIQPIDTMRLTDIFLKKGMKVVLLDMSGIATSGHELAQVVLCDVMQVGCADDTKLPTNYTMWEGHLDELPIRQNVREEEGNDGLTESQLQSIDDVLLQYDCSFRHVTEDPNLTVLYNDQFEKNMKRCPEKTIEDRQELREELQKIVCDVPERREITFTQSDACLFFIESNLLSAPLKVDKLKENTRSIIGKDR